MLSMVITIKELMLPCDDSLCQAIGLMLTTDHETLGYNFAIITYCTSSEISTILVWFTMLKIKIHSKFSNKYIFGKLKA